jgi:uracil-DNA glycosylase family 4
VGLLFADTTSSGDFSTKAESEWLQQLGCKGCALNNTPGKIDAAGATRPEIYILGEAFERREQEDREHFSSNSGELLRSLIPRKAFPLIRFNNTINCHPTGAGHRKPTPNELSCCKPRVIGDIERSKPKVIWGFGDTPLKWVSGFPSSINWRGRRMPVKIGSHTCWYYAFMDPYELHKRARDGNGDFGSEDERMTWFDLERAFADLKDLPTPVVHTEAMARANVECITDVGQISKALQWASRQNTIGLDYETNRLRPYEEGAKILTASVGNLDKSYAFPMDHPEAPYTKQQRKDVDDLWQRFLLRAPCTKTVHNLVFEQEWSGYFYGREVLRAQPWEDTANAAAILDERTGRKMRDGPFSLVFLIQQYFGFNLKKLSNVDRKRLEYTPLETVLTYNGMDSKYHDGLWYKLWDEIVAQGLEYPYELALRRVPTIVCSQLKGVPVNQSVSKKLQGKYKKKVDDALNTILDLSAVKKFERQRGKEFNPGSSKDLLYVFKDILKCDEVTTVDKYTKKEKLSTDDTVLTAIIKEYEPSSEPSLLAKSLGIFREASGTKSKYIDPLIWGQEKCVVYPDGLIHTNFNTYFAETGRLSSDGPNLQNFPKRDAETKEVRRAIEASRKRDELILAFDYGQIEARVIAMFTKDPTFVKALWERFDIHQDWAERLAHAYPARIGGKKFIKDKKVMKDFRTDIKNQWTFPLFFGARDGSVANYLQIPVDVISRQVREFWKMFPTAKNWQEELLKFYREYGYVETLNGRRRRGPMTTNQIFNSPVQGTAAEIVLDAMSRLSEMEVDELQPEINIHDDLTFVRVPAKRADEIAEKVIDTMINVPFKFVNVPIVVEMSVGPNWCDLEELKDESGKTISVYSSDEWKRAA